MKPYYQDNSGITIYHADARAIVPAIVQCDHIITDPPYSAHVHAKQWIGAALTASGNPRVSTAHKSLGFDCLTPEVRQWMCVEAKRLLLRWGLFFSDVESAHEWRQDMRAVGLEYIRTCFWDKVDSAPQFTGDRPASSVEAIICVAPPGRKRWNGGGARNLFTHPVNGANRGPKPHPSTKPLHLMSQLVGLFTDPKELVLDPFCGSGTTLEACKLLSRRAIGIEREEKYCEIAARRLDQSILAFGQ
jgi:DNA modification methylase